MEDHRNFFRKPNSSRQVSYADQILKTPEDKYARRQKALKQVTPFMETSRGSVNLKRSEIYPISITPWEESLYHLIIQAISLLLEVTKTMIDRQCSIDCKKNYS